MHSLVICEKPDAAARIARAIDKDSTPFRRWIDGIAVYDCSTREGSATVCSAIGHLYMVAGKGKVPLRYYPVWDFKWYAKDRIDRNSGRFAKWIRVLSSLAKNADHFVNACDYDIEGAVIGYTLLRYACHHRDLQARRMKFSTMTDEELKTAYNNLSPSLDYGMVEAGLSRHEMDWLYGINLSRFLTQSALKQTMSYATLSSGRVQGPTLRFIVDREKEITTFVPTPFWNIQADIVIDEATHNIEFEKNPVSSAEAAKTIVSELNHSYLTVTGLDIDEIETPPPHPFDLTNLQSEAFRIFRYTPAKTLSIAEKLYLTGLISYPRTSSQKLPIDIDCLQIIKAVGKEPRYYPLITKLTSQPSLRPNNGFKTDSAHPAIYPTGQMPKERLGIHEYHIFDLIVRRFLSTFSKRSVNRHSKITLQKNDYRFFLTGSQQIESGWEEYYRPYVRIDFRRIPDLQIGATVQIATIRSRERFTQPVSRYNPSSLLKKMEKENIGTKATRADIIDLLYRRSYVRDVKMRPTRLAVVLVGLLEKYCPIILDPGLTSTLEQNIASIQDGQITRQAVLTFALQNLRQVLHGLYLFEQEIGVRLSNELQMERKISTTFATLCPECSSSVSIVRNWASRKRFIGCNGWAKGCKFRLPLPQYGSVRIASKNCSVCGFQLIETRSRKRHTILSCPRCYLNKIQKQNNPLFSPETLPERVALVKQD